MSTTNDKNGNGLDDMSIDAIEAELKKFEIEERKRLGLPVESAKHWLDEVPRKFTADQREHTTILVCGLTMAHDLFIQAALRGIGYKVLALDVPDNDALQYGREYGNHIRMAPGARLDDGKLEAIIVEDRSPLAWLWSCRHLALGTIARAPGIIIRGVERATIETDGDIVYHLDGEVGHAPGRVDVRVLASALTVRVR